MAVETEGKGELQAELDRRGTEILRLRDLLIAKDEELGEVKGQLAEMENITRGLMTFAHRVQTKAPRLFRIALGIARRVRRLLRRFGV
ncbi:MAG TPA: hypothetical protein VJL81_14310 [Solirubrobacterales bacterium]|nr:hypothetical protein [Solirubrobacterales bacterium]